MLKEAHILAPIAASLAPQVLMGASQMTPSALKPVSCVSSSSFLPEQLTLIQLTTRNTRESRDWNYSQDFIWLWLLFHVGPVVN